jgi:hypothetical protein
VASNLASVNNFGEVYRIASSAPTTSLDLGDLYFDTTSDTLKVYGASGWQNAGSSINGTSQRYHYDITGTPTSVTGADANGNTLTYDAGYVDVYVNGVRMSDADITVTSGDTVTFTEALANGDEVDIVGYGTFSVASLNADNLDSGTVPDARITGAYTGITNLTMSGNLTVDTNTLYVDSANNNVGIGTVSPNSSWVSANNLVISDTSSDGGMTILSGTSGNGNIMFSDTTAGAFSDARGLITYLHASDAMRFHTANTEAMRIDSSGNLLVGKTNQTANVAGTEIEGSGTIVSTRDNNTNMFLNRKTSDGNLIEFRKDNTVVGSIGTSNGDLYIGTGDTGLRFHDGDNSIYSVNATTGAKINGAIDLGEPAGRFKDLYLSGGVYLGGTDSLHKLDDYEEGTWIPALEDYGGTPTFADAHFTKIGRVVHASVKVLLDGSSDPSGFKISGLPFTSLNTTNSLFGGYVSYTSSTLTNNIYVFVASNDTDIRLYTTSGNAVSYNDIGASKEIRLVAIYFTS